MTNNMKNKTQATADNVATIEKVRKIVETGGYLRNDGAIVDKQSLNAILKVHEKINEENKKKLEELIKINVTKAAKMCWEIVGEAGKAEVQN